MAEFWVWPLVIVLVVDKYVTSNLVNLRWEARFPGHCRHASPICDDCRKKREAKP